MKQQKLFNKKNLNFFLNILLLLILITPTSSSANELIDNAKQTAVSIFSKISSFTTTQIIAPIEVKREIYLEKVTTWHNQKKSILDEKRNQEDSGNIEQDENLSEGLDSDSSENLKINTSQQNFAAEKIITEIKNFPFIVVISVLVSQVLILFLTYKILFWTVLIILAITLIRLILSLIRKIFGFRRYG